MGILIILAIALVLFVLYCWLFKLYKVKSVMFVDGAPGAGKSFLCVSYAVRLYKKAMRRYKIKKFLRDLFPKWEFWQSKFKRVEEPVLYSNILLRNVKFTKLTREFFMREVRPAWGSVVLLDESSLMVDQYTYKDRELSERLSIFWKLFRHSCAGKIVTNSQTTCDLHYSEKYVLSDYLYIHHRTKLPLFSILSVQEMAYCADKDGQSVVNVRTGDIEDSCKKILVLNKYQRYYDSYCYSIYTDDLMCLREPRFFGKRHSLKDRHLLTLKENKYLNGGDK